jgi:bleomycin hydrolase
VTSLTTDGADAGRRLKARGCAAAYRTSLISKLGYDTFTIAILFSSPLPNNYHNMGQNASKAHKKPTYISASPANEADDELVYKLQSLLTLEDDEDDENKGQYTSPLTVSNLSEWKKDIQNDTTKKLAMNCMTGNDIDKIIANTANINAHNVDLFSHNVKFEGHPITNQNNSGRCWLFASTNVFKEFMKSTYNLEDFEFSQNYLFFYDKLEKSNWFLNRILESYDEDIESRLTQFLLQLPENDGGQWDMIVNLVNNYGLVPKSVYPDSASSISSSRLNYFVNDKLREYAMILRNLKKEEESKREKYDFQSEIPTVKKNMLKEIHTILSLTLGIPPDPNDKISWEYKDKFGNFNKIDSTPLEFYNNVLNYKAHEHFSLIHDPRNVEGLYTVDKLGNIEGGKPIEYVNTSIDNLKQAAMGMIKANIPVFFGCDVGKFCDINMGLLDVESWDYDLGFGIDMKLNKKQRLLAGSSQMTHAMVLTGVHAIDGKPIRWKVENSWGEYGEHKGYFVMTDKWFDEYVLQIVTNESFTTKKLSDIWKSKEYKVLPYYDPMGALA